MDNTTKKQAASLKAMAALIGEENIDRFGKIIAEHFKRGNVKALKEGIALLQTAINFGDSEDEDNEDEPQITDVTDDVYNNIEEALGVDNLKPTDEKDNVRLVFAFKLGKNGKGKRKVAGNFVASSVGHPDADEEVVTMRQVLSAFCAQAINTFLKELAKGDKSTIELFNSIKENLGKAK